MPQIIDFFHHQKIKDSTQLSKKMNTRYIFFTLRCVQPTWESTTTIGGWQITLGASFTSASYRSGWLIFDQLIAIYVREKLVELQATMDVRR